MRGPDPTLVGPALTGLITTHHRLAAGTRIDAAPRPAAADLALEELLLLASELRSALAGARPLGSADLLVAGAAVGPEPDLGPLASTASRASSPPPSEPRARQPMWPPSDGRWECRVESPTPPWWIPLIPQRDGATAQMRLRRARMRAWDHLPRAAAGPKGVLLTPDRPLRVREEEVPVTGINVERRWQFARWHDGSTHLWLQHRRRPGRGERSSGIRWDLIDRDSTAEPPPP